jgi:hypothetical protein
MKRIIYYVLSAILAVYIIFPGFLLEYWSRIIIKDMKKPTPQEISIVITPFYPILIIGDKFPTIGRFYENQELMVTN